MQESAICKQCRAQNIHCHGCRGIISVGQNQQTISSETNRRSNREQGEIITDTKCIHSPFWKKWSCNSSPNAASPSSKRKISRPKSVSSWEPTAGKRALLCAVSYNKQKFKLKGTIHDVKRMSELLVDYFKFPSSSIHILAEDEAHQPPTKKNIQSALQWLVRDCQPGDSLMFYFSGHGLRQPDFNDDELDGFDETICPVDFMTEGTISDNEINETIVRPLKQDVTLHAIIDSCHSGTILDLPYVYSTTNKSWMDNRPPSGVYKGTSGGLAICFSACRDDQLAADTSAFTGKEMAGAMTYTFVKAVENTLNITYNDILTSMRKDIKEARETGCLRLRDIFRRKILQEPLLSSSEEFDINKEFKL